MKLLQNNVLGGNKGPSTKTFGFFSRLCLLRGVGGQDKSAKWLISR